MSWTFAILLALGCIAAMALLFRLPPRGWAIVLATLALGLAGYGSQASPSLRGAPKAATPPEVQQGWRLIELRRAMVGQARHSRSTYIITADAFARQGQYEDAATMLRGVVHNDPNDGEAWLALGNALAFHAEGQLTPASLYAYRNAARTLPGTAGPTFFVGLGLIRQGKLAEARALWTRGLAGLPPGAPGREILADRLGALDELVRRIAAGADRPGG
jgi:cytochrome c-type biogenesis protein CcmH